VTGHRRFRAAQQLGHAQVEIIVREPEDKWKLRKKSIMSNVHRKDVRPIELALSLRMLLDDDPTITTNEDLGIQLGKGKTWVSNMLRILDLPEELKAKVQTSELFIPADPVSYIARLDDPKLQTELIDELLQGATVRDIRARINTAKGKEPVSPEEKGPVKPKRVIHTAHAYIVVQSEGGPLSDTQIIAELQQAIRLVRRPPKPKLKPTKAAKKTNRTHAKKAKG